MALKKVRISNNTTDTGIRARIVHFLQQVQFSVDVAKGDQTTQSSVATGHRGVIIYEDFNEEVIATGSFVLPDPATGKNVDVIVSGNKGAYNLSFALF